MANLGNYLFKAENGEDVIANDGSSFFANYAKQALSFIQGLKSLSLSLGNVTYPNGYEEDLVQTERRTHFDPKEWIMPAFTLDESGNLSRILLIHSAHKEEGYVYQVKYKSVVVSFYRGFSIQEFPNEPILSCDEFLESIGIQDDAPTVDFKYTNIDDEDEDAPVIEIIKPSFSGFKKKKILNLGGKLAEENVEVDSEEDEEEELQIEVHKADFQASSKKKIANLGNSFGIEKQQREIEEEEAGDLQIEVSRPSFIAGNGKKPKNLNVQTNYFKPYKKKVEDIPEPIAFSPNKQGKIKAIVDEDRIQKKAVQEEKEVNVQFEKSVFVPAKQAKTNRILEEEKQHSLTVESVGLVTEKKETAKSLQVSETIHEENQWGSIDVFKLKPQVFKGERGVVKAKEFSNDFPKIEACEKTLSGLKSIRVSKKCVFSPKIWEANDRSFLLFKNFDYSNWDFLACTVDKDEDIIYALLSNKAKDKFSILVSFKHHEAHIVGISLNGIALDDRALPYLNFADLKKMVLEK